MKNLLKKTRTVILVRHAETAMNDQNVSRGWSDIPLDEDTYGQLIAVGKEMGKQGVEGIIASDLLRTLQTARCLAVGSGAPILRTAHFLHTWNTGDLTGQDADKVDAILQKMAVDKPYESLKNGESFEEFKYRFLMGLIATLNEYPDKILAFATHGRNLACLNAWAQMGYNNEFEVDTDSLGYEDYEPGSAHIFEIDSDFLI